MKKYFIKQKDCEHLYRDASDNRFCIDCGKQMSGWKIKIRKTCAVCGKVITSKRFRSYCSKQCRDKRNNTKYQKHNSKMQKIKRDALASIPSSEKKQCKICNRWYVQVGSHIVQKHHMTAREYREKFNLPLKKGVVPQWYSKFKGQQALDNKTYMNLRKGKKFRYKKGDLRAKKNSGWKSHHYKSDEFYG